MKKRYGFICLGLSLMVLFAGCNSKKYEDSIKDITKETGEQSTKQFSGFEIDTDTEPYHLRASRMTVTEDGIYYFSGFTKNSPGGWHFYNVHTGEDTALCSNVECKHTDRNTCEAFFNNYHYYGNYENSQLEVEEKYDETDFVYYKKRLYAAKYDYREGTKIVSYDSMGNDMKVEAVVEEDPSYVFYGNFEERIQISNDTCIIRLNNLKEKTLKYVAVSLSDGKCTTFFSGASEDPDKKLDYMRGFSRFDDICGIYDGRYLFPRLEGDEYKLYAYEIATGKVDIVFDFEELKQFLKADEKIAAHWSLLENGKIWFVTVLQDGDVVGYMDKRDVCSYDMQTKDFRRMGLKTVDGISPYGLLDADERYIYIYTYRSKTGEEYAESFEDGKFGEDVKLPGLQVYDINTFELVYECEYRKNINEKLKEYWNRVLPGNADNLPNFYDEVLYSREAQVGFLGVDDRYVYFTVISSSFDPTGVDDTIPYNGYIGLRIDSISEQNPEWVWLWREYSGAQW